MCLSIRRLALNMFDIPYDTDNYHSKYSSTWPNRESVTLHLRENEWIFLGAVIIGVQFSLTIPPSLSRSQQFLYLLEYACITSFSCISSIMINIMHCSPPWTFPSL